MRCGAQTGFVGNGMTGFDDFKPFCSLPYVAVLRDEDTAGEAASENFYNRGRHCGSGFAHSDEEDTVVVAQREAFITGSENAGFQRKMIMDSLSRMNSSKAGAEDGGCIAPHLGIGSFHG